MATARLRWVVGGTLVLALCGWLTLRGESIPASLDALGSPVNAVALTEATPLVASDAADTASRNLLRQDARRETDAPPTVSAPVLTLAGFLEQKFQNKKVVPYESVMGAILTVRDVERRPDFNPKGKELTDEQRAQLEELVRRSAAEQKQAYELRESLRKAALVRSVHAGRYIAVENVAVPSAGSEASRRKSWQANVGNAMDLARARIALPDADWRYSLGSYSSCHDGVARKVVTWYTRFDEPDFFKAEAEVDAVGERHRQRYVDFFASLP